jgi:hypothetical protein
MAFLKKTVKKEAAPKAVAVKKAPVAAAKAAVPAKAPVKAPAKAAAPVKAAAPAKKAKPAVSNEERHRMVAEAAYYLALKKGFGVSDPVSDWAEAEAQIAALLK